MNVTANRRLGQIELALGDIRSARRHLEIAYAAAPQQRATCQLLGEICAISGDAARAVSLWREIDISHGQLDARQWWYDHRGSQQESERMRKAISLLNREPKAGGIPPVKPAKRVQPPFEIFKNSTVQRVESPPGLGQLRGHQPDRVDLAKVESQIGLRLSQQEHECPHYSRDGSVEVRSLLTGVLAHSLITSGISFPLHSFSRLDRSP
jgi:hypothetical protein